MSLQVNIERSSVETVGLGKPKVTFTFHLNTLYEDSPQNIKRPRAQV